MALSQVTGQKKYNLLVSGDLTLLIVPLKCDKQDCIQLFTCVTVFIILRT